MILFCRGRLGFHGSPFSNEGQRLALQLPAHANAGNHSGDDFFKRRRR
jgi:hypothetical protein